MSRVYFIFIISLLCCFSLAAQTAPFSVEDAVTLALSGNPDIKMAEQEAAMARADLGAARADLLMPGIQLNGAFNYADPPSGAATSANDSWSAGCTVRKDLFSGGRFWLTMEAQRLALELAELKLWEKKKEITRATRTGYYNLVLLKEKLRIAVEYDSGLKYRLESARINYANGVSSQLDYLKEQVRYKNNQPYLLKARNDYHMARLAYGAFIGYQAAAAGGDSADHPAVTLTEAPEPSGDILDSLKVLPAATGEARLVEAALRRDLSLRSLDFEIAADEVGRSALWSARWPQLSSSFSYKLTGSSVQSYEPGWSVGAALIIPLDPWLPGVSKVAQQLEGAEALAVKKKIQRRQTEASVIVKVKGLLSGLSLAEESIAGQRENVKQAKLVQEIAQRQYREGGLSSLDLSDAELAYSQALANYWQALYDRYANVLQLNDYLD